MCRLKFFIGICLIFMQQSVAHVILDKYNVVRENLINEEIALSVGGSINLSEEENLANEILMDYKEQEINESKNDSEYFSFSKPFFKYKENIENSKVYQIIRKMPKGAVLHIHSTLSVGPDFMISLTYEDHLYACIENDTVIFQFANSVPQMPCSVDWNLLSDIRKKTDDVTKFDAELRSHFTIFNENDEENPDINTVWRRFDKIVNVIHTLVSYRPVYEKFFYQILKQFYYDNVMYAEIRSGLSKLYELDGTYHDKMYLPKLFQNVTSNFKKDYPNFIGIKMIITKSRNTKVEKVEETINYARKIKQEMPEIYAGFDLVGQEDVGRPLKDFFPLLIDAKSELDYFFHSGETNWFGTPTDENLIDAVLLGSKRIGHGYALIKHPYLLPVLKEKNVAVEVNVISNLILSLLCDVRNHPLAPYLALGTPIVISSDDPGVWDTTPSSHDFYVTFMGVASVKSDLRMLKQLAMNSIEYSALNEVEKKAAYKLFNFKWDEFIKELILSETQK